VDVFALPFMFSFFSLFPSLTPTPPSLLLAPIPIQWGFWLLVPFQIILFVGLPITYTITAAISLQKIVALVDTTSTWGGASGESIYFLTFPTKCGRATPFPLTSDDTPPLLSLLF